MGRDLPDAAPQAVVGAASCSVFRVPKMDCPAEESLVRAALDGGPDVLRLAVDLVGRRLTVWHLGEPAAVLTRLRPLGLGVEFVESRHGQLPADVTPRVAGERRTLQAVLAINLSMFLIETAAGWAGESTGLLADGADMLADALVYALALYAVGRAAALKARAALLCGWLQMLLGVTAFAEVARRALVGSEPQPPLMAGVSALALAANVASLWLVARHREDGLHMKATYICTANDVLANAGVIAAGALVAWTGSRLPDLAIGFAIASLVTHGSLRILALRGSTASDRPS